MASTFESGTFEFPVPEHWRERVGRYLDGSLPIVPARPAATVVLLRDTPSGPEVYLVKRAASMAFAGGRYAFPGGRVDPDDALPLPWLGPDAARWGERFGLPSENAYALVASAVRETFEETGVLFAGTDASSVLGDVSGTAWEEQRRRIETREMTLAAALEARDLALRADLLGAWSRWVTPEFEERRYDTAFFVAALPAGQAARDVSGETESTAWTSPAQALADFEEGKVLMLPPTFTTLRQLLPYPTAADALAASRERALHPVQASVRVREDGTAALIWTV
ncbi:NUDIX hydrolase [Actinospica robiniae]|uniref:NUDIX hydrolase n=1 Tax=Actinospica robiniae TaxID=304901 RepID=UPI000A05FA6B|nr:NUDIX domain-containing protein [Actinospica robiniae]